MSAHDHDHPHSHQHDHDHGHSHSHTHDHGEGGLFHSHGLNRKSKMFWAIGITALILVLEAVGGMVSGSLALLSDAGHMLTDLAALLISLTAMILAEKPASSTHTYGFARLEVLAALGNAITFFLMVFGVAWEAFQRFAHPSLPDWKTMGIIAAIGFLANALSAWFLHGSHEDDINIQGAWIHVMGDLGSSLGVLIGVAVISQTGWTWVDPVLSLAIALLIASGAFKLLRKALHILLESAPKGLTSEVIETTLKKEISDIREVHHIHLWEVGAGGVHLTAHLVVDDQHLSQAQQIVAKATSVLKTECGIQHATLQIEAPTQILMHGPDLKQL
ncbi:MAG TPA: cation diffusion facilitator family transporter [bacterium]|jgi:cobalt-zinc-cadmium efflux system protein|nr:cation diffusion facilitator family transporter [bacterium]